MSERENDKLDLIFNKLVTLETTINEVKRGVHGDEINGQPGLIERQAQDERRIAALEKTDEKRKWWAAGFSAAISLVISFVVWVVKEIWGR